MNWKSLYGIKTKDLRMTSWEGKFNLFGDWQPCNSSAEGFGFHQLLQLSVFSFISSKDVLSLWNQLFTKHKSC